MIAIVMLSGEVGEVKFELGVFHWFPCTSSLILSLKGSFSGQIALSYLAVFM